MVKEMSHLEVIMPTTFSNFNLLLNLILGRAYQQPPIEPSSNRTPSGSSQPTGMYTRNLIGSLTAAAFRLTDPNDHIGIWFVLQDLSVRTEGIFR